MIRLTYQRRVYLAVSCAILILSLTGFVASDIEVFYVPKDFPTLEKAIQAAAKGQRIVLFFEGAPYAVLGGRGAYKLKLETVHTVCDGKYMLIPILELWQLMERAKDCDIKGFEYVVNIDYSTWDKRLGER